MNDINKLLQWCQEARKILAKPGSKSAKAADKFDHVLAAVQVKLVRLTELAGETDVVKDLYGSFAAIARDVHLLAEATTKEYQGKNGPKNRRDAAKLLEWLQAMAFNPLPKQT